MKKFLSVVVFFLALSLSAQNSYRYLRVVDRGDKTFVNLRVRPEKIVASEEVDGVGCEPIRTICFNKFLRAEPVIMKKEGFLMAMELNNFKKLYSTKFKLNYLSNLREEMIFRLGEEFSLNYFNKLSETLNREETVMLWLFVTRIIVANGDKKLPLDIVSRTQEIALVGEFVWRSLYKSAAASDLWVYALHNPDKYSVNLIIDVSGNIITKIMVCPELIYGKNGDLDLLKLVERSSKDLKNFACLDKERRK